MANEGFDPCQCIWNLISILRETQNYCTDTECLLIPRSSRPEGAASSSNFYMTWLIIAFVVLMYVFRPNSLRQLRNNSSRVQDNKNNPNGDPPAPPSSAN